MLFTRPVRCNLILNFTSKSSAASCCGWFAVLAVCMLACLCAQGQQAVSLDAAQIQDAIRALPKHPPTNREVITANHYGVKVAVLEHRNGPAELHRCEDRVMYVLHGEGSLCTGGTMQSPKDLSAAEAQAPALAGCTPVAMVAGTVISVPRGVPYQLHAEKTRVEFMVVRIAGQ